MSGITLTQKADLYCGCRIALWKVLTVAAFAIRRGDDFRCPYHGCLFILDLESQRLATAFLAYMESPEGRMTYPDFFVSDNAAA